MALMHHDTTGTQTDCPRPLSRKKLRSLCNHNKPLFTAGLLESKIGRLSKETKKRLRDTEAEQKREREMILAGVPAGERAPDSEGMTKTSVFKRLSGMFATMTERDQREKAKGK
jgi:hypothetical protein